MVYESPPPIAHELAHSQIYHLYTFVLLAISMLLIYTFYKSLSSEATSTWYNAPDDEYDFLQEEDSAQSRLDLAQAYIQMHQYNDAKIILNELLNVKNPLIKEQSKQLLREMPL